jgi:hypothetical protein
MNGNKTVPVKDWQAEQKKLAAKRFTLCERYYSLQDKVRSMELLRKGAENLMRGERQEQQRTRARGIEL